MILKVKCSAKMWIETISLLSVSLKGWEVIGGLAYMKEPPFVSVPRSTPHTESSTGIHAIVAGTANLIYMYMDCQIPSFLYLNLFKIGRVHKIGQSVTRPLKKRFMFILL